MDKLHRIHEAQARAGAAVLYTVAGEILRSCSPADRVLGAQFRANRKFGSRDRRLITESLFSLFRWWGWLAPLARVEASLFAEESSPSPLWYQLLVMAQALDNDTLDPVTNQWKDWADLKQPIPGLGKLPLQEKAKAFAACFQCVEPRPEQLVPDWFLPGLPETDPLRLIDILGRRPPMWIRLQRAEPEAVLSELRAEGLTPRLLPGQPRAVSLGSPRINLYELPSFLAGHYEVQDFASQAIGLTCAPKPGQRWWDACAGAGGKTLQLADMMESRGTVIASDVRAYKLDDLRKRARRAGFSNISGKPWEGTKLPVRAESFDGVLVDAPCSCSGTWRRNPDGRWTTRAEEVTELQSVQLEILARARKAVKAGGVLVYATCSLCRTENEEVIARFLAGNPDFSLQPFAHPLTGQPTDGQLRLWPWEADSDATFVARMVRK